jgi:hypothetical protein
MGALNLGKVATGKLEAQATAEAFHSQIERILSSAGFAGSRQLREFLLYVGEAALQGRTHISQEELARAVLGLGDSFNPLDDASVRKIATRVRKRLQEYYAKEGRDDPVIVTLPVRHYLPQFHFRGQPGAAGDSTPTEWLEEAHEAPPRRLRYRVFVAAGALVVLTCIVWVWKRPEESNLASFKIKTGRGDFMHQTLDVPASGIQLGPPVPESCDVTVRLRFLPEVACQQAGLMIFENPDQYVKLGRQFLARAELEFGQEIRGRYQKPHGTFSFDPHGQTGQPVWLSIRRRQSNFRAFSSLDGFHWTPVGNELLMPDPMPNARLAIYAHNGRTAAPSTTAVFDSLSIGEEFHSRSPGQVGGDDLAGWELVSNCADGAGAEFEPGALVFRFSRGPQGCLTNLLRPVPKADWTVSSRMDFLPEDGGTAGLTVVGSLGRFRLIRWDLNGGSVSAEFPTRNQVNQPDFPGSPPLVLRLDCRDGVITPSWSRDGVRFRTLDYRVPIQSLGAELRVGLHLSRSTWASKPVAPLVRFSYFRQHIIRLANFR